MSLLTGGLDLSQEGWVVVAVVAVLLLLLVILIIVRVAMGARTKADTPKWDVSVPPIPTPVPTPVPKPDPSGAAVSPIVSRGKTPAPAREAETGPKAVTIYEFPYETVTCICPRCDGENEDSYRFCWICGQRIR